MILLVERINHRLSTPKLLFILLALCYWEVKVTTSKHILVNHNLLAVPAALSMWIEIKKSKINVA